MDTTTTTIPQLGDVITSEDVSTKGTGAYKAEYVNWARVAHLLHCHAAGWQFHLRPTADGQHVWQAPDGTAYVVGYFTSPTGETTPDFPQAIMDNRNNAIPFDRVSARDLTDSHRRCLCTAAAATFGLAWQLWAREPLEDPHQREHRPAGGSGAPRRAAPADRDALQATVTKRLHQLGVTAAGIRHIVTSQAGPEASSIGQLPTEVLTALATGKISQEKVSQWNSAGASHQPRPTPPAAVDEPDEPDDDELPMTWDEVEQG